MYYAKKERPARLSLGDTVLVREKALNTYNSRSIKGGIIL